ncbi:MAG: Gfo/Idh/MocA family oxidoreductase [Kiritimatiellia bacterium]|jgi:predicted dehydrogenase|nr:Gfo/Idh/MocA family oxidoreductase [Kiritimatiellia bacterium]
MRDRKPFSRRAFVAASGLAGMGSLFPGVLPAATAGEAASRKPIRIGQIGTGNQHAYKMATLRKLPDLFEVVGLAGDRPGKPGKAPGAACYKGLNWMSQEELLAIPGLQAVAVETEERLNVPVALNCIRAGKHIHLDKPCGESLPAFKKLLDEAEAAKLTVQVGYMYRNNPAVQFCIRAVKEGLIGRVVDLDASMGRYDGQGYRTLIKQYKGGIQYILACHLIDLMVSIMGAPERVTPYQRCTRGDGVLDNGLAVFEFDGGRLATVRTSITEAQGFSNRRLKVMGDKGTILIEPLESKGNRSGGVLKLFLEEAHDGYKKGAQTVNMPPPKDRYEDQWREFAAVVNGEIVNPYTYAHDHLVHKCHLQACAMPIDV